MANEVNIIELPIDDYERFKDLQRKILTYDIDPDIARYEMIEILSPHWTHVPEPWERTEVRLKKVISSIITTGLLN